MKGSPGLCLISLLREFQARESSSCVYELSIELCKQGQSFREERKGALLLCSIELCHSAYIAFSISYLAQECKT